MWEIPMNKDYILSIDSTTSNAFQSIFSWSPGMTMAWKPDMHCGVLMDPLLDLSWPLTNICWMASRSHAFFITVWLTTILRNCWLLSSVVVVQSDMLWSCVVPSVRSNRRICSLFWIIHRYPGVLLLSKTMHTGAVVENKSYVLYPYLVHARLSLIVRSTI